MIFARGGTRFKVSSKKSGRRTTFHAARLCRCLLSFTFPSLLLPTLFSLRPPLRSFLLLRAKGKRRPSFLFAREIRPPRNEPCGWFRRNSLLFFFSRRMGGEGEREVRGSWIADRRRLCSTEYSERVRTRRVLVERLRLSLRNDPLLLAGLKLHLPTTRLFYDSSLRIYVRENRRSSTTYVIILMR